MTNPTDREDRFVEDRDREANATSGLPDDLVAMLEDRSVMIPRDLEVFSKMIYKPEDILPATTASADALDESTDREEGALSELGDKERRFVEDQRRIAARPMSGGTCVRTAETVELERQDALLAEAAKVLQAVHEILFPPFSMPGWEIAEDVEEWWHEKARSLLDKLEAK